MWTPKTLSLIAVAAVILAGSVGSVHAQYAPPPVVAAPVSYAPRYYAPTYYAPAYYAPAYRSYGFVGYGSRHCGSYRGGYYGYGPSRHRSVGFGFGWRR